MENNQTAIDWLEDNLIGNPHSEEDFKHNINIWGQSKQMEKEQIKRAFEFGVADAYNSMEDEAEDYYNQTYKQQDNGK